MKTTILTAALLTTCAAGTAAAAPQAGPDEKKPRVCRTWDLLIEQNNPKAKPILRCTDGKRPFIATRYVFVDAPNDTGRVVRFALVWR